MKKKNPYLLPENVKPTHYDLQLKPDLEKFTFTGEVGISVVVFKPISQITLNAVDLKILEAEAFSEFASFKPIKITFNKKMETITLHFKTKLGTDMRFLKIRFEGELNDKMHGFYRTWYEVGCKKIWGAATQFEATDARRAFPCWDEPAKKATFALTITVPEDYTTIFNTDPEKIQNLGNGYKQVSFPETPKISTYLVCFIVAHLKCIEDRDANGVPIRVWAIPGKEKHGRFALEIAKHSLEFYRKKFGISYQSINPKLDMIACPDFAAGAMENLGAVTYRETAALIDPKNYTAAAERRVAEVVMHENAHMWFGDLVTMRWWNGLWLNEGFATFMSYCAMHDKFPEWGVWTQFFVDNYLAALRIDSLKNTHPLEIDVKNPYEIKEIFDEITYSKGSVVNRMLEQYLSEDFWKGLRLYLECHSYQNADTTDLWAALEEVSGKPVHDIMARYTKQPGYPVVFAKGKWESLEAKQQNLKLKLQQKRFLADGSKDQNRLLWKIPLSISTRKWGAKSPTSNNFLMENRTRSTVISFYRLDQRWVKLNTGQSSFCRVGYDNALWRELILAVRRGEIPNIDRIGLLDDSMALARAGYIKTSQALDMIAAQENDKEFDYNVWSVVIRNLNAIDHILESANKGCLAKFARALLWPAAQKLGWNKTPEERHTDTLLRSRVLIALGKYGSLATIKEAQMSFENLVGGGKLDPDLKGAFYILVAENGDERAFDELIKIYDATGDSREKERIQVALGSFQSEVMIKKVIEFSLSDKVRKQDWFRIMATLGNNPKARMIAWNFLKENWEDFKKKYEGNLILLVRTLEGVTSEFTDKETLADIKKFFKAHPLKEAKRTMKQVVETIETNIQWKARDEKEIKNWLAKR